MCLLQFQLLQSVTIYDSVFSSRPVPSQHILHGTMRPLVSSSLVLPVRDEITLLIHRPRKKLNVKFRSGNNCFAQFMPLSEELQNHQTFQLADTLQRKRCQPSVLTNCPDRKEGPFQGVNAGTIRVSSNITIRGLVTTMGNWGSFRLTFCCALKTS